MNCPWESIDRGTLEFLRYARLAERHLPIAGGMLDQTQSFCEALDWATNERRRWKNEMGTK